MGDLKYEMDEYGNVRAVGGDGASGGSAEDHIAALKEQLNKPAAKPPDEKQADTNNSNHDPRGPGCCIAVFLGIAGLDLLNGAEFLSEFHIFFIIAAVIASFVISAVIFK